MVTAASYHQNRIFEVNQVSAGHLDALNVVRPEQLRLRNIGAMPTFSIPGIGGLRISFVLRRRFDGFAQDLTGLVIGGYLMLTLLWMCPLASLILAKTCRV